MSHFQYAQVPRLWPGETVVVVGGGASLRGFDRRRLDGRRVIAVNAAWEDVPSDILYWGDARWWRWEGAKVRRAGYGGQLVTSASDGFEVHGAWVLRNTETPDGSREGLETSTDGLRGTMSGGKAVNLAAHLTGPGGRVVLLGFDGKADGNGRFQYHDRHRIETVATIYPSRALPELRSMAAPLAAMGVEVINATPGSLVDWWPVMRLEDALS